MNDFLILLNLNKLTTGVIDKEETFWTKTKVFGFQDTIKGELASKQLPMKSWSHLVELQNKTIKTMSIFLEK